MKKILLAGACALALTSAAFAQSGSGMNNSSGTSATHQGKTTGSSNDASVGTSATDKRTIPGSTSAGGSNPSSPNTTQPGASKTGSGG